MSNNTRNIGSNFDDFLKEENILEETLEAAIKRVLAYIGRRKKINRLIDY
jgi:hypothetical protein